MIGIAALLVFASVADLKPVELSTVGVPRLMFMCMAGERITGLLDVRHDKQGNFLRFVETSKPGKSDFAASIASASSNSDPKRYVLELRTGAQPSGHKAAVVLMVENEQVSATYELQTDTESSGSCTRVPVPPEVKK